MFRNNEDERPVIKAEDNSQLGFAFQDSQSQNSNLGMSNIPASTGSGYQEHIRGYTMNQPVAATNIKQEDAPARSLAWRSESHISSGNDRVANMLPSRHAHTTVRNQIYDDHVQPHTAQLIPMDSNQTHWQAHTDQAAYDINTHTSSDVIRVSYKSLVPPVTDMYLTVPWTPSAKQTFSDAIITARERLHQKAVNPLQPLPPAPHPELTVKDQSLLTLELISQREQLEAKQRVLIQELRTLDEVERILELNTRYRTWDRAQN
ncbi:hypothetical protein M405DRAFT_867784 [Rhizopogon salebrosus TDB-379]|nr:hypothetical protein M405DRAFT_867784 [Rhizopogon salebrosus TDB-379]